MKKKKQAKEKIKKSNYYAVIFNNNGIGRIFNIPKNKTHFKINVLGRRYNFVTEEVMIFKRKTLFSNKYYLFYDIDNPDPLKIEKHNVKPRHLRAEEYDSIIETKVIEDINRHKKLPDLPYKEILIGVVVLLGVVGYFMSGGV